jgi:trans-2,3-dihydro-3-hydroxyanthranilate isomerase
VDAVTIDSNGLQRCCRAAGMPERGVFVFTTETAAPVQTVYSRMLAPGLGVAEDPATGSASGPLGCYLVRYGVVAADVQRSMISIQGVAMRRPSRIHIDIEGTPEAITSVRVGGKAVLVGRGELSVP